ncbi:MAG: hypothetical protein JNM57_04100 [Cyclobacteriaceae bacterium]|nr:hypothetical protein [Cyclobacteriaceae bacterium]
MKVVARIFSLLMLLATMVFYTNCDGDDPKKSETDTQLEKLNGTWRIINASNVTQDGAAPPFSYVGFTLTINGTAGSTTFAYTATERPEVSPWPANGTFTFGSPVAEKLTRNDSGDPIQITYSVTATGLIMTFPYSGTGFAGGRTSSVSGPWRFEFTKQ